MLLALIALACVPSPATAQAAPRWEYAVIHVTAEGMVIETRDGPPVGERPGTPKLQAEWDAAIEARRVPGVGADGNVAAMLTAAGASGWEVVGVIGEDRSTYETTSRYLARRAVP